MMQSMTGFARATGQGVWAHATWELRSVNHRYLEIAVRLPEDLRSLESAVRQRIGVHVKRGKVDCGLRCDPCAGVDVAPHVQMELARQVVEACQSIAGLIEGPAAVSPLEILRWPGVIALASLDVEAAQGPLLDLLDTALAGLIEGRQREGARLGLFIEERCGVAEKSLEELRRHLPTIMSEWKDRLLARAQDLFGGLDPGRVEQEMLIVAQRLDVAEELERLTIHLGEIRRLVAGAEPVGRKLDFLLQEMNREANTVASKSSHATTTGAAVDLKVIIEQMREQAQNIE